MTDTRVRDMSVEVVGGHVAPADLQYARGRARRLCEHAPRAIRHFRTRLCADMDGDRRSSAVADAILVLDGDIVICAGAVAPTMCEAIDQLCSRLHRRITARPERDEGLRSPAHAMAATTAT